MCDKYESLLSPLSFRSPPPPAPAAADAPPDVGPAAEPVVVKAEGEGEGEGLSPPMSAEEIESGRLWTARVVVFSGAPPEVGGQEFGSLCYRGPLGSP